MGTVIRYLRKGHLLMKMEDERTQFELWACKNNLRIQRDRDNDYLSIMTNTCWKTWQARAALNREYPHDPYTASN